MQIPNIQSLRQKTNEVLDLREENLKKLHEELNKLVKRLTPENLDGLKHILLSNIKDAVSEGNTGAHAMTHINGDEVVIHPQLSSSSVGINLLNLFREFCSKNQIPKYVRVGVDKYEKDLLRPYMTKVKEAIEPMLRDLAHEFTKKGFKTMTKTWVDSEPSLLHKDVCLEIAVSWAPCAECGK